MFDRQQDLKTIRRCKRGEEDAFAEILGRYRGPIYNLCYRMTRNAEDARDLGQEVFIKVFSLLDRFDENYAFSSWLFRIATNHCLNLIAADRAKLGLDFRRAAAIDLAGRNVLEAVQTSDRTMSPLVGSLGR